LISFPASSGGVGRFKIEARKQTEQEEDEGEGEQEEELEEEKLEVFVCH
jgi:hypothetical protein